MSKTQKQTTIKPDTFSINRFLDLVFQSQTSFLSQTHGIYLVIITLFRYGDVKLQCAAGQQRIAFHSVPLLKLGNTTIENIA
jgi:hypothetical protein